MIASRERTAWTLAGIFLLIAMVALFLPRRNAEVPALNSAAASVGGATDGTPPDLSSMTPRERFDRLYNRVMQAAESGRTDEVARFSPMAFAAYDQLDSVDADARYHAAVLHLHLASDTAAALRLADSIEVEHPKHLFALLIRGTAAKRGGDTRALARWQQAFLAAWDGEMRAGRPEYNDHRVMLDEFRAGALAIFGGGRTP